MLLSLPIGNRSEKSDQNSLVAQSGDEKTDWQSVKDDSKAVESDSDETYEKQLEELLLKEMKNKTLIMITHRMDILNRVDKIIFLKENGCFAVGRYQDLIKNDQEFKKMMVSK